MNARTYSKAHMCDDVHRNSPEARVSKLLFAARPAYARLRLLKARGSLHHGALRPRVGIPKVARGITKKEPRGVARGAPETEPNSGYEPMPPLKKQFPKKFEGGADEERSGAKTTNAGGKVGYRTSHLNRLRPRVRAPLANPDVWVSGLPSQRRQRPTCPPVVWALLTGSRAPGRHLL